MGTTLFMVFSVKYTICKAPKLYALRTQSVTSVYCRYDSIHQHKKEIFFLMKSYLFIRTFSIVHWDT